MRSLWDVVGGTQKGGIIVRGDRDTSAGPYDSRLATGSIVEEVQLIEGRLKYRLIEGSGPDSGWVSVKLKDVALVVKRQEGPHRRPSLTEIQERRSLAERSSVMSVKLPNLLTIQTKSMDLKGKVPSRHSFQSQGTTECPLSPLLSSRQSRACSDSSQTPSCESCRSTSKDPNEYWNMPVDYSPLQHTYSIEIDSTSKPKELGRGAYGVVYKGLRKEDGKEVAIKVIERSSKTVPWIAREADVLRRVSNHPNIAKFVEIIDSRTNKYSFVVTELCRGCDLWDYIKEHGPLSEDRARQCLAQLLDALEYIHRQGVVHHDVKRENVMLDDNGVLTVIDFGLSDLCQLRTSRTTGSMKPVWLRGVKGTPGCMAPEVLEGKYRGPEADVWGAGVLLYEMLTGMNPFQSESKELRKNAILSAQYNTSMPEFSKLTPQARHLLKDLFVVAPSERPTIQQVRQSDWMSLYLTDAADSCYSSAWATMPQRYDFLEEEKQEEYMQNVTTFFERSENNMMNQDAYLKAKKMQDNVEEVKYIPDMSNSTLYQYLDRMIDKAREQRRKEKQLRKDILRKVRERH